MVLPHFREFPFLTEKVVVIGADSWLMICFLWEDGELDDNKLLMTFRYNTNRSKKEAANSALYLALS